MRRGRGSLSLAVVAAPLAAGAVMLIAVAPFPPRPFFGRRRHRDVRGHYGRRVGVITRRVPTEHAQTAIWSVRCGPRKGDIDVCQRWAAPVRDPEMLSGRVVGQGFGKLPTGLRISFERVPAQDPPRPTPVLFLHCGPGIADMAGDAYHFGELPEDRYDFYIYGRVRTGRSSQLTDPRDYTFARHVAGLEAIRRRSRGDRIVFIGHSRRWRERQPYLRSEL